MLHLSEVAVKETLKSFEESKYNTTNEHLGNLCMTIKI